MTTEECMSLLKAELTSLKNQECADCGCGESNTVARTVTQISGNEQRADPEPVTPLLLQTTLPEGSAKHAGFQKDPLSAIGRGVKKAYDAVAAFLFPKVVSKNQAATPVITGAPGATADVASRANPVEVKQVKSRAAPEDVLVIRPGYRIEQRKVIHNYNGVAQSIPAKEFMLIHKQPAPKPAVPVVVDPQRRIEAKKGGRVDG
jgi:hypothetical protein